MKAKEIIQKINQKKARSAWEKGLKIYAAELIQDMESAGIKDFDLDTVKKWNWNGAGNALIYSEGACSLVYEDDICNRLCPPSITRKHPSNPNGKESWIEVQARALTQAMANIRQILRETARKEAE